MEVVATAATEAVVATATVAAVATAALRAAGGSETACAEHGDAS